MLRTRDGRLLWDGADLVHFLDCSRRVFLDRAAAGTGNDGDWLQAVADTRARLTRGEARVADAVLGGERNLARFGLLEREPLPSALGPWRYRPLVEAGAGGKLVDRLLEILAGQSLLTALQGVETPVRIRDAGGQYGTLIPAGAAPL